MSIDKALVEILRNSDIDNKFTPFGRAVIKARLSCGATLRELGVFTGKGSAFHCQLELGNKKTAIDCIESICDFFNRRGVDTSGWVNLAIASGSIEEVQ